LSDVRFSVVVAAYNAARTVGSAIRSVLAQTRQDFEVIVVDDGSTDGTAGRVAGFSDERIRVVTQPNQGPSAARNTGVGAAGGTYVSMLDADDLWLPEYLEVMGGALDADPGAAFAYTDAWVLDDETGKVRRDSAMSYQRPPATVPDARAFYLLLLETNFVYTSVTARRAVLEAVGGYDETLRTGEDWDLWLRIARRGERAVRPPGLLAVHRQRHGSLASDGVTMTRNVCEVYRRLAADTTADDEVRELARRQLDRWEKTLRRLEEPTARVRVRAAAGALKRRALRRRLWLDRRPEAVERTLEAVGELN
jgi:glycosyltransferase involved in cell wall biosynthesis